MNEDQSLLPGVLEPGAQIEEAGTTSEVAFLEVGTQ
jgi:hypothetical protein